MVNVNMRSERRRFRKGRRFSLATIETCVIWIIRVGLIPDLGDLSLLGGVALLGWVLYQITPILTETYVGVLLVIVGVVRMGWLRRREE